MYNPNNKVNTAVATKYTGNTSNYNDNSFHTVYNTEELGEYYRYPSVTYTTTGDQTLQTAVFTAGLDFKASNRVHFMPNVWLNTYASQIASNKDKDVVLRLTFFLRSVKIMTTEDFKISIIQTKIMEKLLTTLNKASPALLYS
jgi:hypothetical protein